MNTSVGAVGNSEEILGLQTARDANKGFVAVAVICLLVGYSGFVSKAMTRRREGAKFTTDDWMASAGLLLMTGFVVSSIVSVTGGIALAKFLQAQLASELLYTLSLLTLKLSFLVLYRPLLSSTLRMFSTGIAAFIILYSFADVVALLAQCSPHGAWLAGKPVHCIDIRGLLLTMGIFDILTNILVLILPLPTLYRSHEGVDEKTEISTIVAIFLGIFASVFSIARTAFVRLESHHIALLTISLLLLTSLHVAHLLASHFSPRPDETDILQRQWYSNKNFSKSSTSLQSSSSSYRSDKVLFPTWGRLPAGSRGPSSLSQRSDLCDASLYSVGKATPDRPRLHSRLSSRSDKSFFNWRRSPEPSDVVLPPVKIHVETHVEQLVEEVRR